MWSKDSERPSAQEYGRQRGIERGTSRKSAAVYSKHAMSCYPGYYGYKRFLNTNMIGLLEDTNTTKRQKLRLRI